MDKYITDLDQATAVSDSDTLFGNINGQAVQIPVGIVTKASYKLKRRITISENTRTILINEDEDGNGLNLCRCHIGIVIPPDSSISSSPPSMTLRINGVDNSIYSSNGSIGNGFRLSTIAADGYSAGIDLYAQGTPTLNNLAGMGYYARYTLTDGAYSASGDRYAYTTAPTTFFEKITQIEVMLASSSIYFPLGTIVEVWGM